MTATSSPSRAQGYPAPGSLARYDGRGENAEAAIAALPKSAQRLLDAGKARGLRWAVLWKEDTGGNPFVRIKVAASPYAEVDASWHTRDHGTLRLFSILGKAGRGTRRGTMTLAAAVKAVETMEAD